MRVYVAPGIWYDLSLYGDNPRPIGRPTRMAVGAIGWTQDSIAPRVYNVTTARYVDLQDQVEAALNAPEGAANYLQRTFPDPIRIYFHPMYGYLSLDNRRLTIFRMALHDAQTMPVRILTEQEAGSELARNPDADQQSASLALQRRLTTTDGGYSICIRQPERPVISQGVRFRRIEDMVSQPLGPTAMPPLFYLILIFVLITTLSWQLSLPPTQSRDVHK
ncbi:hypothetical protein ARMSODRAFT_956964 [Armillaria solidipes]|uniref:Uncharacterized protein n=1 Tax=Armillaria solidipes TaxID=1076256 RepID=A0A2H3BKD9_9AGAR|nr:hypothetical protein ARMSODRAFT_956964 [Armillaria solidipes]